MYEPDMACISDGAAETTGLPLSQPYLLLKTATAMKLGKHAEGGIRYQILTNIERQTLMFKMISNEGGGYFSKEVLAFGDVGACLAQHQQNQPFPSKLLQTAFTGRSSNNAGFLAAILRAEGLLALAPDTEGRHVISGDWQAWRTSTLAVPGQLIEMESVDKEEEARNIADSPPPTDDAKAPTRRGKK